MDEAIASALRVFLLAVLVAIPANAEPQDRLPKGFEVLNQFLGVWETQATIRNEGPPSRKFRSQGRAVGRQALHGRYVEFRTQAAPAGAAELQLMTYDPEKGVYRQWVFDSDGYHHRAEGRWNPTTSILRWEGTTGGTSFVIEDRWVSPTRLEWTLVRTDAGGRRLQTIEGALMRTSPPASDIP